MATAPDSVLIETGGEDLAGERYTSQVDGETFELENLVTVALFPTPFEAGLARAHLEAEGIRTFIANENFIHLYGSLAGDGIKLQVPEDDAPRARQLLAERKPLPEIYLVTKEDEAELLRQQAEAAQQADLVTVGRYVTAGEARLVRSLLEANGIAACVSEERLPPLSLLSSKPIAANRVEVHRQDAEEARALLASVEEQGAAAEEG
jgi:hypothetical protein